MPAILETFPRAVAPGREERLNYFLWAFLVVANAVDVLASGRAFEFGIAEVNPFAELIIANSGIWTLALFKAFWILMLLPLLPHVKGWTRALLALACTVYGVLTIAHVWFLSPLL